MFDFYEKRRLRQILYSKLTYVILVIIVLLLFNSVWNLFFTERDTRLERKKLEKEFAVLEIQEAQLRSEIERLTTPEGVEEEIRSKFEVSKEGENVMVIIDSEEKNTDILLNEKRGFWAGFLSIFKNN